MSSSNYSYAVGRRKRSSATVKLFAGGTGKFSVRTASGKVQKLHEYFGGNLYLLDTALSAFYAIDKNFDRKYDAEIVMTGGGISGQADALKLAFARALIQSGTEFRATLKPLGLLKRDGRKKERKKPGLKKARKAPTWSKR